MQVVEVEQMVYLGDRVRNCTAGAAADNASAGRPSAAALPAAASGAKAAGFTLNPKP